MKGGAIARTLLQQMAQSAYSGKTKLKIGPFELIYSTPTLKFYKDGTTIVVSIRGTQLNDTTDLAADGLAILGKLRSSARYKKDKETLQFIQTKFPKNQFRYIGVAHSLGAAILDLFLRDGLILNGLSYNGLAEPQELGGNPLHRRVYHRDDPLYKVFGHIIPNVEVRVTADPFWKYFFRQLMPKPLADLIKYYESHKIRTFEGGKVASAFATQLKTLGVSPSHYLEMAKQNAKQRGYETDTLEFSDNKTHKLQMRTPEGRLVRFGRVGYNDFLLWDHQEAMGKVKKGTARAKQDRFWKSHLKIKGKWKDNLYSPNWLALNILW